MVTEEKSETRTVNGHEVEYRKIGDFEEVRIDGAPREFFHVGEGYQLRAAAYAPPKPTLLEAAVAFAETLTNADTEEQ